MKAVFLGTGTSHGVPLIACDCPVCTSPDPRNQRLRASLLVQGAASQVLIDTTPDLRTQALRAQIRRVDAVLITHTHADHIFGFDDLRRFFQLQKAPIPIYGMPDALQRMADIFSYVDQQHPTGASVLRVEFRPVTAAFELPGLMVTPLPVRHGQREIYGYLIEEGGRRLGYVPDCSGMDSVVVDQLRGVDVMILDALRKEPHPTHFTLAQSLAVLREIGAGVSYITHLCHKLEHAATQAELPSGVFVPQDGLAVDI